MPQELSSPTAEQRGAPGWSNQEEEKQQEPLCVQGSAALPVSGTSCGHFQLDVFR